MDKSSSRRGISDSARPRFRNPVLRDVHQYRFVDDPSKVVSVFHLAQSTPLVFLYALFMSRRRQFHTAILVAAELACSRTSIVAVCSAGRAVHIPWLELRPPLNLIEASAHHDVAYVCFQAARDALYLCTHAPCIRDAAAHNVRALEAMAAEPLCTQVHPPRMRRMPCTYRRWC